MYEKLCNLRESYYIYNSMYQSDFVFSHCNIELDWIDTKNLDSPFLVPILFNDTMDLRHEEVLIKFFTTFFANLIYLWAWNETALLGNKSSLYVDIVQVFTFSGEEDATVLVLGGAAGRAE